MERSRGPAAQGAPACWSTSRASRDSAPGRSRPTLAGAWPGLQDGEGRLSRCASGGGGLSGAPGPGAGNRERSREVGRRSEASHPGGRRSSACPRFSGFPSRPKSCRIIEQRLGCALFEIPTMPPGVTGMRMKEAFERGLAARQVGLLLGKQGVSCRRRSVRSGFRHRGRAHGTRTHHPCRCRRVGDRTVHGRRPAGGPPRRAGAAVRPAGSPARAAGRLAPRGFPGPPGPPGQPRRAGDRRVLPAAWGLPAGRRTRVFSPPARSWRTRIGSARNAGRGWRWRPPMQRSQQRHPN
ncbi:MAG: hypothetical protein MZV70_08990 [Desulfobacterales bacterium]|nr:hypothetical protein [Desulfobacterales bacterium]